MYNITFVLNRLRVFVFGSASREALLNRLRAFKQSTTKRTPCFLFSSALQEALLKGVLFIENSGVVPPPHTTWELITLAAAHHRERPPIANPLPYTTWELIRALLTPTPH